MTSRNLVGCNFEIYGGDYLLGQVCNADHSPGPHTYAQRSETYRTHSNMNATKQQTTPAVVITGCSTGTTLLLANLNICGQGVGAILYEGLTCHVERRRPAKSRLLPLLQASDIMQCGGSLRPDTLFSGAFGRTPTPRGSHISHTEVLLHFQGQNSTRLPVVLQTWKLVRGHLQMLKSRTNVRTSPSPTLDNLNTQLLGALASTGCGSALLSNAAG